MPATSLPSPHGNVDGHRSASAPSRIFASPGLIDGGPTLTSSSPGPGNRRLHVDHLQDIDPAVFVKSHGT